MEAPTRGSAFIGAIGINLRPKLLESNESNCAKQSKQEEASQGLRKHFNYRCSNRNDQSVQTLCLEGGEWTIALSVRLSCNAPYEHLQATQNKNNTVFVTQSLLWKDGANI